MTTFSTASSLPSLLAKVDRSSMGRRHPPARKHSAMTIVSTRSESSSSSSVSSSSSEVYVAAIPLVGLEAVGAALGDRYPDRLEHTMVLVRHGGGGGARVTAYDFLPIDPLSPFTAARLASGGCVPGELRVRPLRGLPSRRCWKVGDVVPTIGSASGAEHEGTSGGSGGGGGGGGDEAKDNLDEGSVLTVGEDADAEEDARRRLVDAACLRFQREYDANLSLAGNSCREHTIAMAAYLTGVNTTDVQMPESIFT